MNYLLDFGLFQAVWNIRKWWILGSFCRDPFRKFQRIWRKTHISFGESDELFWPPEKATIIANSQLQRDGETATLGHKSFQMMIPQIHPVFFCTWCHHFYCHHLMKNFPSDLHKTTWIFQFPTKGHCWRPFESDSKPKKVRKAKALAELSSTRSQSFQKSATKQESFMVIYE